MDGFERNEHRDLDRGLALETREEPAPPPREETESDDDVEPSFFSKWTLPTVLFLLTVFTTLWAGA
ncbi:MAG: hypothetical protein ACXW38_07125, partial [Nitrospira sp.]